MGYRHWMLVEGRDDQYVLRELLGCHHIACAIPDRGPRDEGSIMIDKAGNITLLLKSLEIILDDADLERLGIVVDADEDVGARWDAVRNILVRFGGRDLPHSPDPGGTIATLEQRHRTLTVGVWIMPDNQVPGILENFVSFLIPDDDAPLWQRARNCVDNIPENELHFSDVDIPKAQIHTWLAWQREPGQPLGIAITAKFLDADAPYALSLINWAKQLFDIP